MGFILTDDHAVDAALTFPCATPAESTDAGQQRLIARAGNTDVMLDDDSIGHSEPADPEAQRDAVDGWEGIDEAVKNRDEGDDGDWVEILHQIVRNAVTTYLASLKQLGKSSNVDLEMCYFA